MGVLAPQVPMDSAPVTWCFAEVNRVICSTVVAVTL